MDSLLTGEITCLIYCGLSSEAKEARNGMIYIFFLYREKETVKFSKTIFQEWGKIEEFLE